MECNCLPKLESTCLCLPIKENSACGADCSHGKYTSHSIKVLGTAVLLLSLATGYLLVQTHQLGKSLQKLQTNDETHSYLAHDRFQPKSTIYMQQKSSEIHRVIEYRRRKRSNHRRKLRMIQSEVTQIKNQIDTLVNTKIPNLETGIMKKVAHLKMSANMTSTILHEPVNSINGCRSGEKCLRWSSPESIYSSTFDYMKDTAYNMPVAIKVRSPGVYLVYAQVAFNGPQQGYEPSLGFETVLVHGDIVKSLIKSYITQDDRGRRYIGRGEYPFDTVNQMGMFKLECDDYILIRPIGAPNFVFRNTEASYFGLVQINPVRGLLQGDHSCNAQE